MTTKTLPKPRVKFHSPEERSAAKKARNKVWWASHPEVVRGYIEKRKQRRQADPKYAQKNNENAKRYYHKNLKAVRERQNNRLLQLKQENPLKVMLYRKKKWAEQHNIDFDIEISDLELPETCPVLGIPLTLFAGHAPECASFDRVDPNKGYIKGNVKIISFKANRLKNNATPDELRAIVAYIDRCNTSLNS